MDGPDDDAYGRVTDPGRYAVLHAAADPLLDGLTAEYVVERSVGDVEHARRLRGSGWDGDPEATV